MERTSTNIKRLQPSFGTGEYIERWFTEGSPEMKTPSKYQRRRGKVDGDRRYVLILHWKGLLIRLAVRKTNLERT